jgi:hypothetical protein
METQDETEFIPKLVEKLVCVPVISFCKIFISSYAFDALLCRNWPFSPLDRLTLRIPVLLPGINLLLELFQLVGPLQWFSFEKFCPLFDKKWGKFLEKCEFVFNLTRFATLLEKNSRNNLLKKIGRNSPDPIIQCLFLVWKFCYLCETYFWENFVLKARFLSVKCLMFF